MQMNMYPRLSRLTAGLASAARCSPPAFIERLARPALAAGVPSELAQLRIELVLGLAPEGAARRLLRMDGLHPALRLAAGVLADTFRQAAASAGDWLCRGPGAEQGPSSAEGGSAGPGQEAELARLAQQAEAAVRALIRMDDSVEVEAEQGKLDPEPYLRISSAAAEVGAPPLPHDGRSARLGHARAALQSAAGAGMGARLV